MKKIKYLILYVTIAVSLLFYIGGCSGGGGGGSDGDDGLTYSGLITQAELSDQNVVDISGGAFGAGLIGDSMMGVDEVQFSSLDQSSNEHFVGEFRSVKVPQILRDSLHLIDFTAPSAGAAQAALDPIMEDPEPVEGNCGGILTFSFSVNDIGSNFSGSFTFSDYCHDGTTINGKVSFDGSINLETGDLDDAYLSFDTLSGGGLTLDGDIDIVFNDAADEVKINAYGQDPEFGKVYWIKNYNITFEEGTDGDVNFVQIRFLDGNFYHPDYGYVTLARQVEAPFILYDGDEWPTSGTLVVTGANNTKAKITAVDNQKCTVEADIDGDDEYDDMDPVTRDWDEI